MLIMRATLLALGLATSASAQRREMPTFTIDLDQAPEDRYTEVCSDPAFNATIWDYYNTNIAPNPALQEVLYGISDKRGPENDEMMGEITGIAATTKLPFEFVKAIQMLNEITSIIMVPIVNFSSVDAAVEAPHSLPKGYEALADLSSAGRGFGCTGIIARNRADGTVSHARNLDLSPPATFSHLVYNGVFTKGGQTVFTAQTMAGYTMVVTGYKQTRTASGGPEGFAIERNTRFISHFGGAEETLAALEAGVALNGWQLRKVLEEEPSYAEAVSRVEAAPYASTEYDIISGVNAGVVLAKSVAGTAHRIDLGAGLDDYIIMTNFDYYWNDIREFFDPTGGGGFGKPSRRGAATALLDAAVAAGQPLTPELLFSTINAQYVLADTIYQAIMSVENQVYNTSIPVPYGGR